MIWARDIVAQRGVGNANRRRPDFLEMLPYVDLEESASHQSWWICRTVEFTLKIMRVRIESASFGYDLILKYGFPKVRAYLLEDTLVFYLCPLEELISETGPLGESFA